MVDTPPGDDHVGFRISSLYALGMVSISFAVFVASLFYLFNAGNIRYYSLSVPVYLFIMILPVTLGNVPVLILTEIMVILYFGLFTVLFFKSTTQKKRLIDSPAGYFAVVTPAIFLLSIVSVLIEQAFGVSLGGAPLEKLLRTNPYMLYNSLIYAPFVEEFGFRILPLGIFIFLMIYMKTGNLRDSALSFFAPGFYRERYGLKLNRWDLILVIITSAIWAYAHVYFGVWDLGKILPVAIAGIALGFAYLKFGPYLDILMHWLMNGPSGLFEVYRASFPLLIPFYLIMFVTGVAGIILLIRYSYRGHTVDVRSPTDRI